MLVVAPCAERDLDFALRVERSAFTSNIATGALAAVNSKFTGHSWLPTAKMPAETALLGGGGGIAVLKSEKGRNVLEDADGSGKPRLMFPQWENRAKCKISDTTFRNNGGRQGGGVHMW